MGKTVVNLAARFAVPSIGSAQGVWPKIRSGHSEEDYVMVRRPTGPALENECPCVEAAFACNPDRGMNRLNS